VFNPKVSAQRFTPRFYSKGSFHRFRKQKFSVQSFSPLVKVFIRSFAALANYSEFAQGSGNNFQTFIPRFQNQKVHNEKFHSKVSFQSFSPLVKVFIENFSFEVLLP
jgi:hypothetical protein